MFQIDTPGPSPTPIELPFASLNSHLGGGLGPGLSLLCGPLGAGKTRLMLQIMLHALRSQRSCLLLSPDTPTWALTRQLRNLLGEQAIDPQLLKVDLEARTPPTSAPPELLLIDHRTAHTPEVVDATQALADEHQIPALLCVCPTGQDAFKAELQEVSPLEWVGRLNTPAHLVQRAEHVFLRTSGQLSLAKSRLHPSHTIELIDDPNQPGSGLVKDTPVELELELL